MNQFIAAVIDSFTTLFIILDPFLGLAVFSTMTKGMSIKDKMKQATIASGVALSLLLVFMFLGTWALDVLGINFASFKVAGGIILLLLGIQAVMGIEFTKNQTNRKAAAVLIGTPLLCGPGAMTAITVLRDKHTSYLAPMLGAIGAAYITWIMLTYSHKIEHFVGQRMVQVISRVMGLILAALAIQFIYDGILMMI